MSRALRLSLALATLIALVGMVAVVSLLGRLGQGVSELESQARETAKRSTRTLAKDWSVAEFERIAEPSAKRPNDLSNVRQLFQEMKVELGPIDANSPVDYKCRLHVATSDGTLATCRAEESFAKKRAEVTVTMLRKDGRFHVMGIEVVP